MILLVVMTVWTIAIPALLIFGGLRRGRIEEQREVWTEKAWISPRPQTCGSRSRASRASSPRASLLTRRA